MLRLAFRSVSRYGPAQYVGGNVRPELAKTLVNTSLPIAQPYQSGESAAGAASAGVIRNPNSLRDGAAQQLGNIHSIVAVVVGRDEDASADTCGALEEGAFTHGVIAFVLMEHRWQCAKMTQ